VTCVALQIGRALNVRHIGNRVSQVTTTFQGVDAFEECVVSGAAILIRTVATRVGC